MAPNGYYPGGAYAAPAAQPPMNGAMGGGYYPPQMQQNQFSSRAHLPPGANPMMQQTPRDPYTGATMPGGMPGLVSGVQPVPGAPAGYAAPPPYPPMQPDAGYAVAAWQQQRAPGPDAYGAKGPVPVPWGGAPGMPPGAMPGVAGGMPGQQPGHPGHPGHPGQPGQVPGAPQAGAQPGAEQAGEPDPDDDPNRLPTFVKVRGLPAEHDPRIARRPKPKKRAPGVCCA